MTEVTTVVEIHDKDVLLGCVSPVGEQGGDIAVEARAHRVAVEVDDVDLELLVRECGAAGTTVLFVSHDARLGALFDRRVDLAQLNRATARAAA